MNIKKYLSPIHWNKCSLSEQTVLLMRPILKYSKSIQKNVQNILNQVLLRGDHALIEFNSNLDHFYEKPLKVSYEKIINSENILSKTIKQAIHFAMSNITKFHQLQHSKNIDLEVIPGVHCKQIIRPINTVGLYIPGGLAPLPSTVMMLGIPAKLAQCNRIILCSPPPIPEIILYTANLCGIKEIYQVGGSQSIAAMGFGTESIPKVDKIFGPGNIWVTEAKRQINYRNNGVSIDMLAGPSEILIIADETANPIFIAADLLSQAEHGPDSHVILITTNDDIAHHTRKELYKQLQLLSRNNIIHQSLVHAKIIIADDIMECLSISNNYAPEHLILQIQNSSNYLKYITNAGSIFLGHWSPESVGDYVSGPNHVLPTYGNAVSVSGLSVTDFQKRIFVQKLSQNGLLALFPTLKILTQIEQLQAHQYAATYRVDDIIKKK